MVDLAEIGGPDAGRLAVIAPDALIGSLARAVPEAVMQSAGTVVMRRARYDDQTLVRAIREGINADGKRELKCKPEIEARFYETSRDFDGLGRILRASVPLLILFGEQSDSLGVTLAETIASKRPRS